MNIIKSINERKTLLNDIAFILKINTKLDVDNLYTYNLIDLFELNSSEKHKDIFEVRATVEGLLYFSTIDDQLIFSDNLSIEQLNDFFNHLLKDMKYKKY